MSDQRELRERLNLADEIEKYAASRDWRAGDWVRIVAALREADEIASLRAQLAKMAREHDAYYAKLTGEYFDKVQQLASARKAMTDACDLLSSAMPEDEAEWAKADLADAKAELGQMKELLQDGLYCEIIGKNVPVLIDGGFRDTSVGMEEGPSLTIEGYELVPVSLMNDIREMHGWEKLLDLWQQTHGDLSLSDELREVEK